MATEQTLFEVVVPLGHQADVTARISGKHHITSGVLPQPWEVKIYWDGVLINYTGGAGALTDVVFCEGAAFGAAAGNHTLKLTWFGHQTTQLRGVNAIVEWSYK